jgi:hypothetical protein
MKGQQANRRAPDVSREAKTLLGRLQAGPVALADVIDLSTAAGDLAGWCSELQAAGLPVVREADPDGAWVRWRLTAPADVGPAPRDVGPGVGPGVGSGSTAADTRGGGGGEPDAPEPRPAGRRRPQGQR